MQDQCLIKTEQLIIKQIFFYWIDNVCYLMLRQRMVTISQSVGFIFIVSPILLGAIGIVRKNTFGLRFYSPEEFLFFENLFIL